MQWKAMTPAGAELCWAADWFLMLWQCCVLEDVAGPERSRGIASPAFRDWAKQFAEEARGPGQQSHGPIFAARQDKESGVPEAMSALAKTANEALKAENQARCGLCHVMNEMEVEAFAIWKWFDSIPPVIIEQPVFKVVSWAGDGHIKDGMHTWRQSGCDHLALWGVMVHTFLDQVGVSTRSAEWIHCTHFPVGRRDKDDGRPAIHSHGHGGSFQEKTCLQERRGEEKRGEERRGSFWVSWQSAQKPNSDLNQILSPSVDSWHLSCHL